MGFTHSITRRWTDGYGTAEQTKEQTADGVDNRDISVPGPSTNLEIDLVLEVANLKSLFIACDVDATIKTNSSSAPDDTLALKANQPIAWQTGDVAACPFSVDVTKLFVTIGGTATATLQIRALVDA